MAKFNGFEKYLIVEGLKELGASMKEGIRKTEAEGKRPLMTEGYIDMVIADTLLKLEGFSIKEKKSK
jgi:hypothetical protein